METKAGFTLLILSVLAFLLDGCSGVFLCSDLISGGSVVTFDNGDGNDGHGDGGDLSNTSFDRSPFAHGGGEIVEIDEILTKEEEAPSLAMTATFVSVGDDIDKTAARVTTPCLNGLRLDQLGFNLIPGLAMTSLPIGADNGGRGMVAARASVLAPLAIGLVWACFGSARVSLQWALVDAPGLGPLI